MLTVTLIATDLDFVEINVDKCSICLITLSMLCCVVFMCIIVLFEVSVLWMGIRV